MPRQLPFTTLFFVLFCFALTLSGCKKDNEEDANYFVSFVYNNKTFRLTKDAALYFNASPYIVNGRTGLAIIAEGNAGPFRMYVSQTDTTLGSYSLRQANVSADKFIYEATISLLENNSIQNLTFLGWSPTMTGPPFTLTITKFTASYIEASFEGNLVNSTANKLEPVSNGKLRLPYVR